MIDRLCTRVAEPARGRFMIRMSLRRPTSTRSHLRWAALSVTSAAVALLGAATLQAQQVTDTTKRSNAVVDTAAVDTAVVDSAAHPTALAPDTGATQAKTDTSSTRAATDTTARHTVKKGDTLWDLANFYLRNPFLWPQIYKLNTDIVRNPHWIYPGQRLRLPNG